MRGLTFLRAARFKREAGLGIDEEKDQAKREMKCTSVFIEPMEWMRPHIKEGVFQVRQRRGGNIFSRAVPFP